MKRKETVPPDGKPAHEQPRWRRDFPIDWPEDDYVSRRDFTGFMVLTSLALVVGQFWIVIQNYFLKKRGLPSIIKIAKHGDVPIGGTLLFKYPDELTPCLLIRLEETNYVAYNQQCTHLSCPVIPRVNTNSLHCPCHEGKFDLNTGQPLSGPPRRPLPRINIEIRGDAVYATGVERKTT